MAPLTTRLLLRAEVNILCSSLQQGALEACGEHRGGPHWPLPHPTPGAQDWRLQRVGLAWPHRTHDEDAAKRELRDLV